MRVVISCDDGEYYLRQYAEPLVPESFQTPAFMLTIPDAPATTEVPDYVVQAYCALQIQDRTMQYLLSTLDEMKSRPLTGIDRQD